MLLDVTAVEARPEFLLDLEFENGERRRFDMSPYLHYPIFRRLENPGFFSLARAEHGTVVWPGDIDIAPETLYELSVPVETCQP
ncbi:MAG: DUF2442 domain-containing protein [Sulfuritalea sp.]|jgi:hypothetical protein|nr:DUF2442 domain-containing protein [Sulfuritalea sp.]MBK9349566.1 DUF2442 domain-containing protein [Sulfuritalea sp.]